MPGIAIEIIHLSPSRFTSAAGVKAPLESTVCGRVVSSNTRPKSESRSRCRLPSSPNGVQRVRPSIETPPFFSHPACCRPDLVLKPLYRAVPIVVTIKEKTEFPTTCALQTADGLASVRFDVG